MKINLEEEFTIPLDISDIVTICREYSKLGWVVQSKIDKILDGETSNNISPSEISQIKNFLIKITENPYFGDATAQAAFEHEKLNNLNIICIESN